MKHIAWSLLFLTSCLPASRELLCRADADCASDETCEVVSGLCKPAASPSQYGADVEAGTFGVSGAFDCPILDPRENRAEQALGRATVILGMHLNEGRVCGREGDGMPNANRIGLTGLRTGCVVRRDPNRGVGPNATRSYLELEFAQVDSTPDNPVARVRFVLREEDGATGGLAIGSVVHGRFSQRCKNNDGSTEIELRAIADAGDFSFVEIGETSVRGHFDVRLMMIEHNATQTFGEECTVARDCSDGCSLEELGSVECTSGTCVPELSDPMSGVGFCSAACEDSLDCDGDDDPFNYCLRRPMTPNGTCIRLCDPDSADACPEGQSCRPGSDFGDFPDGNGPPRCLDECIGTASTRPSESCAARPARRDGGAAIDGGVAIDGGRARDGGATMRDGGAPPIDGGVTPDGGANDGSALGQTCSASTPCPNGWFCGSTRLNGSSMNGTCTRVCPNVGADAACQSGYAGVGVPVCGTMIRDIQAGQNRLACVVACGDDFGGEGSCPGPLVCQDRVDNSTRMPPSDGQPDFCGDP
ncbi:MAG: hypothetical protein RIT81_36175 [Deltaproteobacteria bacterium]